MSRHKQLLQRDAAIRWPHVEQHDFNEYSKRAPLHPESETRLGRSLQTRRAILKTRAIVRERANG